MQRNNDQGGRTAGAVMLFACLVLSAPSRAQSAFNGTWRPDPEVYSSTRQPDVIELAHGYYACQSCTPPYKIRADGLDQHISGNPYYDSMAIVATSPATLKKIAKKSGKTIAESEITVSSDGTTATERQTVYFMSPRPIEMTTHSTRLSPKSPGSHAISGTWRATGREVSNQAEDTIFKVRGGLLEMSDRMGRSFTAKLDGSEAPYRGSAEFTSVTLKGVDDHTLEESDKRDGKVVKVTLWSIGPGDTVMHVRFDDTKGHVQEQTGHKVQ